MKILMVTASYPPSQFCGVGDNTFQLVNSQKRQGFDVDVFTGVVWKLSNFLPVLRGIRKIKPNLLHVQYPSIGYGFSLIPHILGFFFPAIVTIHEMSQVNVLRRISLFLFFLSCRHVIFTNNFERNYALKFCPWLRRKSSVVPIGISIPAGPKGLERRQHEVVYFGLIRPEKGLENVLRLAQIFCDKGLDYTVRILGTPDPRCKVYYDNLVAESSDLPVTWESGLSDTAVGEILSSAGVAYLPFPDGASERRSSLLACLNNRLTVVTTPGIFLTDEMRGVVELAASPEDAFEIIVQKQDTHDDPKMAERRAQFISKFAWEKIVEDYTSIYNSASV